MSPELQDTQGLCRHSLNSHRFSLGFSRGGWAGSGSASPSGGAAAPRGCRAASCPRGSRPLSSQPRSPRCPRAPCRAPRGWAAPLEPAQGPPAPPPSGAGNLPLGLSLWSVVWSDPISRMTLQEKKGLKEKFFTWKDNSQWVQDSSMGRGCLELNFFPQSLHSHPSMLQLYLHHIQHSSFICITPNTALKNKWIFIFSCKRFYLQNPFGPALSGMFLQALPDLGSDCPTHTWQQVQDLGSSIWEGWSLLFWASPHSAAFSWLSNGSFLFLMYIIISAYPSSLVPFYLYESLESCK